MSVELAQAYVTIIPTTKGAEEAITGELTEMVTGEPMHQAGEAAGGSIGGGIISGLGKMAIPAAIVGGIAAAGTELYKVGETFDGAFDTIALGTGATGEALDSLNESFENVVSTMPGQIDTMASTFADLNTRTGATGETLEGLTKQFTALDLIGYGADVGTVTAAFNAWGIETDSMGGALDDLFTISQTTGTSIDELASGVSGSAGAWSAMGFSFSEAAAMVGQFEKAGLNASSMATKMASNIGDLTEEGETNADAFTRLTGEMQTYIEQGDYASARDIAEALFGTKNADAFLQALETGTLDVTALMEALESNDGAILASEQSTRDFSESMELLKNNAALALEPLGSAIFSGLGELLAGAVEPAQNLALGIHGFFEDLTNGNTDLSTFNELGGKLSEVFDKLVEAGTTIWEEVGPEVLIFFGSVTDAAGLLLDGLGGLIDDGLQLVIDLLNGDWSAAFDDLFIIFDDIGTTVNDMVDTLFPGLVEFVSGMVSDIGGFFDGLKTTFIDTFLGGIQSAWETVSGVVQGVADFIGGIVTTVSGYLSQINSAHAQMTQSDMANYDPSGGVWGSGGIARHAEGGVTRKLHIVGEAGPEAIVPLYAGAMDPFADAVARRIGGGGQTVNVFIDGARVNDGEHINAAVGGFLLELDRLGAI